MHFIMHDSLLTDDYMNEAYYRTQICGSHNVYEVDQWEDTKRFVIQGTVSFAKYGNLDKNI